MPLHESALTGLIWDERRISGGTTEMSSRPRMQCKPKNNAIIGSAGPFYKHESFTPFPKASRNASGDCAPDNVTLPLMMRNGTPSTPCLFMCLHYRFQPIAAIQHDLGLFPVKTSFGN
jgi:hypothetical protein